VRAKVKTQSSPFKNGLFSLELIAETVMSKYVLVLFSPSGSVKLSILNNKNLEESYNFDIFTCPFIVLVESSITLR
jgi:hypothetical protein